MLDERAVAAIAAYEVNGTGDGANAAATRSPRVWVIEPPPV